MLIIAATSAKKTKKKRKKIQEGKDSTLKRTTNKARKIKNHDTVDAADRSNALKTATRFITRAIANSTTTTV